MTVWKGELKQLFEGQPDLADNSQGKIAWKGDALNQILGEDKHGRNKGEMIRNENDTVQQANTYSVAHKQSRENATTVDNGLQSYRASNEPHNLGNDV
ncbi:hypothetical protein E2562_020906 [Oryza meyeriana var. granulata]|uniref:Uncharacterized protein n=1 Tax=Oryza meyeriana var. granulata TaxID=110450 RepID=A0A6G1D606_9ORYZ|nr:hypothetical protein E2562_020906 [Oryza meyeriana var. granulata]